MRKLKADEIEVKVNKVNKNGCQLLLYKTSRVDMQMLDDEFTPLGWQAAYQEIKGNLYCGIGVKDKASGEWVWKWDCGIESREDSEGNQKKGEASDAFKRAGFKWGIGRELYNSPFIWLEVETKPKGNGCGYELGNGCGYELVDKFPSYRVQKVEYDEDNITDLVIVNKKGEVVYSLKNHIKKVVEKRVKNPSPNEGEWDSAVAKRSYEIAVADLEALPLDTQKLEEHLAKCRIACEEANWSMYQRQVFRRKAEEKRAKITDKEEAEALA